MRRLLPDARIYDKIARWCNDALMAEMEKNGWKGNVIMCSFQGGVTKLRASIGGGKRSLERGQLQSLTHSLTHTVNNKAGKLCRQK